MPDNMKLHDRALPSESDLEMWTNLRAGKIRIPIEFEGACKLHKRQGYTRYGPCFVSHQQRMGWWSCYSTHSNRLAYIFLIPGQGTVTSACNRQYLCADLSTQEKRETERKERDRQKKEHYVSRTGEKSEWAPSSPKQILYKPYNLEFLLKLLHFCGFGINSFELWIELVLVHNCTGNGELSTFYSNSLISELSFVYSCITTFQAWEFENDVSKSESFEMLPLPCPSLSSRFKSSILIIHVASTSKLGSSPSEFRLSLLFLVNEAGYTFNCLKTWNRLLQILLALHWFLPGPPWFFSFFYSLSFSSSLPLFLLLPPSFLLLVSWVALPFSVSLPLYSPSYSADLFRKYSCQGKFQFV